MPTTQPKLKVDRDEVFLEYTRSICPICKMVIDAEVNVRDNRVILRKRCGEHGVFEALVYSDAELYMAQQRFNKPGTIPLEFQTEVLDGCPLDCGMCPEHKQHACLGIIEVNSGCNLDCPICFADSGHQPDGYSLSLEQVDSMLDVFVIAHRASTLRHADRIYVLDDGRLTESGSHQELLARGGTYQSMHGRTAAE